MSLLNGRIAVVTGAGSGIGRAICRLLAKEGAKVIAADVDIDTARETISGLTSTKASQGSSIVNIASIIGKTGNIGQCNYSASKAGVEALTKSASMEFGKFGVRVNAVLPGVIETPIIETIPDAVREMFLRRIALQRFGKAEEVAELVLFLASPKSSYINGASIEVTGGIH